RAHQDRRARRRVRQGAGHRGLAGAAAEPGAPRDRGRQQLTGRHRRRSTMVSSAPAEPPRVGSTGKPVASIKDVTHRYRRVVALDRISLDIPSGIMVGIVGPDGVGKLTLMALVAGSKKLQDGTVTVLGGDIADRRH